jgi:hypothetical protein
METVRNGRCPAHHVDDWQGQVDRQPGKYRMKPDVFLQYSREVLGLLVRGNRTRAEGPDSALPFIAAGERHNRNRRRDHPGIRGHRTHPAFPAPHFNRGCRPRDPGCGADAPPTGHAPQLGRRLGRCTRWSRALSRTARRRTRASTPADRGNGETPAFCNPLGRPDSIPTDPRHVPLRRPTAPLIPD